MKNIFDDFDWDEYYRLMDVAHSSGVHVVHQNNIMGGFTFAWQRATDFPKSKMVVVAVSFCSIKDQFSRKIGTFNALNNFFNLSSLFFALVLQLLHLFPRSVWPAFFSTFRSRQSSHDRLLLQPTAPLDDPQPPHTT